MTASGSTPAIYGAEPIVAGRRCSALICEQFVDKGVLISTANVTFIKLEGDWHRLTIDHPAVHWRTQMDAPLAWSVPDSGWEYPHVDVAARAQLVGSTLKGIESASDRMSTRVTFIFSDQRRVEIRGTTEATSYAVI
jgi:hypothetical protein